MDILMFLLPVVLAVSLGCFVSRLLRRSLKWPQLWLRLFSGLVSCVIAGALVVACGYFIILTPHHGHGDGHITVGGFFIFGLAPLTGVVGFILGLGGR